MKIVLVLICVCHVASAQINEGVVPDATEYQALKDIYNTMGGTSWTTQTNWPATWPSSASSAEFAIWFGVTVSDGDITVLNLPANNLTGPIPSSIGQLTKLVFLNFEGNHINGSIPGTIGNLSSLTRLFLDYNQLTGSIPATINGMGSVYEIWLNNNQLTGSLPASMASMSALNVLNFSNNQLSGALPDIFDGLDNLTTLRLLDNDFSGDLPDLSELVNLTYIDLGGNQFTGPLPAGLSNAGQLTSMRLGRNMFSGTIPVAFGTLINLKDINLDNNQLTGSIPSSFENLTELTVLWMQHNQLTGEIPPGLSALKKLLQFSVDNNHLTGNAGCISGQTALVQLMLHDNQFSGTFPDISNLSHLQYLGVQNNNFQNIQAGILSLNELYSVNFSYNKLTSLPDFSALSNKSNVDLQLVSNNLTIEDIIPIFSNGPHGFRAVGVAPQNLIDVEKVVQSPTGAPLTLTATIDRTTNPASVYQWFRFVNGESTAFDTPGHTVTTQAITPGDNGTKYYYTITHPLVDNLMLTSRYQTLEVFTCSAPTLDFASEELNGSHTFNPTFTGEGCTPTYIWDFGDGATSTEQGATHTYSETGTFTVSLTVSYTCGSCPSGQLTTSHEVTIANGFCGSIYCDGAGGVGIGTRVTEGFRLSVNGKIRASDIIKVYPQNQWSDFVFEKDYKLRPLSEVETFIKQNGHLPEIPSAKEVETQGIDLGGMDAKLLQKIEELTLYMIELKKENEAMKKQLDTLSKRKK